ncbi:hypothetical protein BpHYR1_049183 [Brachionus plicatilis]|uniref:Uncharacterized protein n=1 Tax=Brachionus plicatilis TaxID=10195 RepID=A0A3M7S825_BRAPC|nr:hypothetical protein BpHYR1_049183 [Brachionus plicatilis]
MQQIAKFLQRLEGVCRILYYLKNHFTIESPNTHSISDEHNFSIKHKNLRLAYQSHQVFLIGLECLDWDEECEDLEYKMVWQLFSPLTFNAFSKLICMNFDTEKCLKLWRNGLLYEDAYFHVLVKCSDTEISLSVRMMDVEKNINIISFDDKSYLSHIRNLLTKFHVAKKIKFKESYHPLEFENNEIKILTQNDTGIVIQNVPIAI